MDFKPCLVKFSNDDRYMVCASGDARTGFAIFSTETRQCIGRSPRDLRVYDAVFSCDGDRIISSDCWNGIVTQWDIRSLTEVAGRSPGRVGRRRETAVGATETPGDSKSDVGVFSSSRVMLKMRGIKASVLQFRESSASQFNT